MMKIEPGARAAGMGGAYASISGDPYSAAYNSAGARGVSGFTAGFGHNEYWENARIESGYLLTPLSSTTYLHAGIRFAGINDIAVRQGPSAEPDGLTDSHDISFKAGLGLQFAENLYGGMGIGWYLENVEAYRGSAFNVDLGVLAQLKKDLWVGASVTNAGSAFNLTKEGAVESRRIKVPTTYRVGASYRYQKYLGAADIVILDNAIHEHLGAEARVHKYFSVRAGYMFNYDSKNFTAGATFTSHGISVDYAFVPYSNSLGSSHLFNFTFQL